LERVDISKPPASIYRGKTVLPSDSLFPDFGNTPSRLWKHPFLTLESMLPLAGSKTSSNESQNIIG